MHRDECTRKRKSLNSEAGTVKKALITGVTGQDGSYLSELLIEKEYDVRGVIRRSSVDFRERIAHIEVFGLEG